MRTARERVHRGDPVGDVTYEFQQRVDAATRSLVAKDMRAIGPTSARLRAAGRARRELGVTVVDELALDGSPPATGRLRRDRVGGELVRAVDVDRADEASR